MTFYLSIFDLYSGNYRHNSDHFKVTVKARGLCYNKSSPGKTTEPIDIKQIEDEYKMNELESI